MMRSSTRGSLLTGLSKTEVLSGEVFQSNTPPFPSGPLAQRKGGDTKNDGRAPDRTFQLIKGRSRLKRMKKAEPEPGEPPVPGARPKFLGPQWGIEGLATNTCPLDNNNNT